MLLFPIHSLQFQPALAFYNVKCKGNLFTHEAPKSSNQCSKVHAKVCSRSNWNFSYCEKKKRNSQVNKEKTKNTVLILSTKTQEKDFSEELNYGMSKVYAFQSCNLCHVCSLVAFK